MYKYKSADKKRSKLRALLFAAGPILNSALEAQTMLAEEYNVAADVWSVTSFKELYKEASATERWNRMHPTAPARKTYIDECLDGEKGVCVIASDHVRTLPDSISAWFPADTVCLGTDGFGRSDSREALRDFFEVDARFMVLGVLEALAKREQIEKALVEKAMKELQIDPEKPNPASS